MWGLGKLALLATNNDRALALSYGVCGSRQNLAQLLSNRL
jgi:D-alanyl-D-alanine carboxypeptidase